MERKFKRYDRLKSCDGSLWIFVGYKDNETMFLESDNEKSWCELSDEEIKRYKIDGYVCKSSGKICPFDGDTHFTLLPDENNPLGIEVGDEFVSEQGNPAKLCNITDGGGYRCSVSIGDFSYYIIYSTLAGAKSIIKKASSPAFEGNPEGCAFSEEFKSTVCPTKSSAMKTFRDGLRLKNPLPSKAGHDDWAFRKSGGFEMKHDDACDTVSYGAHTIVKYPSATVRTLQDALDKCKRISEQKQSLTSKPKPMTTKLQEFRNKIYFTDSKMKEIAELVEQAEGVVEELDEVVVSIEDITTYVKSHIHWINEAIELGDVKLAKTQIKQLKANLGKLNKDGTFQVVSKATDVLEKLYEELD